MYQALLVSLRTPLFPENQEFWAYQYISRKHFYSYQDLSDLFTFELNQMGK